MSSSGVLWTAHDLLSVPLGYLTQRYLTEEGTGLTSAWPETTFHALASRNKHNYATGHLHVWHGFWIKSMCNYRRPTEPPGQAHPSGPPRGVRPSTRRPQAATATGSAPERSGAELSGIETAACQAQLSAVGKMLSGVGRLPDGSPDGDVCVCVLSRCTVCERVRQVRERTHR